MVEVFITLGVNVVGNVIGTVIGGVISYYIIKRFFQSAERPLNRPLTDQHSVMAKRNPLAVQHPALGVFVFGDTYGR